MLKRVQNWLWENRVDVAIAIVLFIVAAVPRMADLGMYLTADEKSWMGRSYEFIRAIKDWRFNDTLQTTHPGVTTLWLSGAAITARMFLTHTPFSFENLAHFAAAAQFPIALVNSLSVPAVYFFLRRLFFQLPDSIFHIPLLASLFIALNPLLIGYSRVAHVDALLSSLMFLAALATLLYVQRGYARGWLIASAVLSGLAILTKAPAVFLLPFLGLAVLVRGGIRIQWLPRLRDLTLWLLIVTLIFLIIWPAMLFVPDPKGNALLLKRDLGGAALTPHHMVEDYTLNTFHYPLALLTRTTPVALVFASLGVITLLLDPLVRKSGHSPFVRGRKQLWLFVAYVFFFIVMMTLVAKKGDRYILPVFPALDVLAAFGILGVWSFIGHWSLGFSHWRSRLHYVAGAIAVMYLVVVAWGYHPYSIAYSNPLFPDNLSQELGWGEGLEQVARWLNESDPQAVVASWYPEELGAYTSAHVAHINAHEQPKVEYVVLYRNMFGRSPDHYANDFIDEYYKKREPAFVASVAGKEFAWVYPKLAFETIVGELTPGVRVEQELSVTHDNLIGVDVLAATYTGRAKSGELVVSLWEVPAFAEATAGRQGQVLHTWHIPVSSLENDRWMTLRLPANVDLAGQKVSVSIEVVGTSPQDAPTVRSTKSLDSRPLAVRLRYRVNGQEATEEDTLLLKK